MAESLSCHGTPFPWDVVELTHGSSGPGNLAAMHQCSKLCPATVTETPTQGFGWRSKAGEKPRNNPGSSWGY